MPDYDLYRILKEELKNGSVDLVTRQSGQIIRERIEKDIVLEEDRSVITIHFSGIGIVDYSCADEIVAKLVSRLLSNEYGDKYIVLKGLNEHQKENIEVALERKNLAVMALLKNGTALLLGSLNNYLKETLGTIFAKEAVTAKDLSGLMKLEANTSGTRLLNLYEKKRLVVRKDEIRDGGRVWVYHKLV